MLPQLTNFSNPTMTLRDRLLLGGTMHSPERLPNRPKLATYVTFRKKLKYQRPAPLLYSFTQNMMQKSASKLTWSQSKKKEQGKFKLRKCDSEWRLEHFQNQEEEKTMPRVSKFDTSEKRSLIQQDSNNNISKTLERIDKSISITDKRNLSYDVIGFCKLPTQTYNNYKYICQINPLEQKRNSLPKRNLSKLLTTNENQTESIDKLQDCINNIKQQRNTGYTEKLNDLRMSYIQKQELIEKLNQNDQVLSKMKRFQETFERDHPTGNPFTDTQTPSIIPETQVHFFLLFVKKIFKGSNQNKQKFIKMTKREQREKELIKEFKKLVEISLTQAQEMDGRLPILIKSNNQQYNDEKQIEIAILEKFTNEKKKLNNFILVQVLIKHFPAFQSKSKIIIDRILLTLNINPYNKYGLITFQNYYKLSKLAQQQDVKLSELIDFIIQFFAGDEDRITVQEFKRILRMLTDQVDSLAWHKSEQTQTDSKKEEKQESLLFSDLIKKLIQFDVLPYIQRHEEESRKLVNLQQLQRVLMEMRMDVHELANLIFKDYTFKKIIQ